MQELKAVSRKWAPMVFKTLRHCSIKNVFYVQKYKNHNISLRVFLFTEVMLSDKHQLYQFYGINALLQCFKLVTQLLY